MTPPTQPEPFRHEPLDLTKHSFRVINICGLSEDGLVDCTVSTYNREDVNTGTKSSYNALSYTWGPEQPCRWIRLNGKRFCVRQNLLDFLKTAVASHPAACENIFIDAICINQSDTLERNHQVMQMAGIYRNATTVFAWLGQPDGEYDELIMAERRFQKITLHDWQSKTVLISEFRNYFNGSSRVNRQLMDLLSRDYWSRMWIIQEIILGQANAQLLCGACNFRWETMKKMVMSGIKDKRLGVEELEAWCEKHIGRALHIITTTERIFDNRPTLVQLLKLLKGGGDCTDPRDKVYALLGLARDSGATETRAFDADYSISLEKLFFKVLEYDSESTPTEYVLLRSAVYLARYLGLTYWKLREYLENPEEHSHQQVRTWVNGDSDEQVRIWMERHCYRKESFWMNDAFAIWTGHHDEEQGNLWSVQNKFSRRETVSVDYQFDHDQSIGATSWVLDPDDFLFEFECSGAPSYIKKAIVLRRTDTGAFSYVAMAEYSSDYSPPRKCFLYHLPALQAAAPFYLEPGSSTRLIVPATVFLVLSVLSQMEVWVASPQNDERDWEFLGIKGEFMITHSTVVNCETSEIIHEEDCQEMYDGYSPNLE